MLSVLSYNSDSQLMWLEIPVRSLPKWSPRKLESAS
jgi:hypothetical protein